MGGCASGLLRMVLAVVFIYSLNNSGNVINYHGWGAVEFFNETETKEWMGLLVQHAAGKSSMVSVGLICCNF